jgi:hypothetical protein
MKRFLWAVGIVAVFLCFRGVISQYQLGQFIGYFLGLGIPAMLLLRPLFENWKAKREQAAFNKDFQPFLFAWLQKFNHSVSGPSNSGPAIQPEVKQKPVLSPAQIAQLNKMRQSVSLPNTAHQQKIRISGSRLDNVVPEAGVFTAQINRGQGPENIVLMLATLQAVADFARLLEVYTATETNYAATGVLLPSKSGVYSVLLVTNLVLCGQHVQF